MKPIPGFSGYYADIDGSIHSERSGTMKAMSTVIHHGYPHVFVRAGRGNDTVKKLPVHTLVLSAYAGRREPRQVCRHLNGDPNDNRVANLCWGTYAENARDAVRHGTAACLRNGEDHSASKLKNAEVLAIHKFVDRGMRRVDAAFLFRITARHVGNLVTGAAWPHLLTHVRQG